MRNFFVRAVMNYKLGNPSVAEYISILKFKHKLMRSKDPIVSIVGVIL